MDIRSEIDKIPELKNIGHALIDFVEDICPGIKFEQKGKRWVAEPKKFVAFKVQYLRVKSIAVSMRGYLQEFPKFDELPLKHGMGKNGAYTECTLKKPGQLPAIAICIRRAYDLYEKGPYRSKKKFELKV